MAMTPESVFALAAEERQRTQQHDSGLRRVRVADIATFTFRRRGDS